MASPQQGAQAQQPTLCCIDASGGSPWPSVVRPDAPVGHTPLVQPWGKRAHLAALSAIWPEGQWSVACQGRAIHAADVVALLAHRLREVPGRLVIIGEGAPIHRRHVAQALLRHGAAPRRSAC